MAAAPAVAGSAVASRLYREDVYTWALEQAAAIRRGDWDSVDREHVAEEIEGVAELRQEVFVGYCARSIEHLLKIEHYEFAAPGRLEKWRNEVKGFRVAMARQIRRGRGMAEDYPQMLDDAWEEGRALAVTKLANYDVEREQRRGLKIARRDREQQLPLACPYRIEEITALEGRGRKARVNPDIWPPGVARVLNSRCGARYPVRQDRDWER